MKVLGLLTILCGGVVIFEFDLAKGFSGKNNFLLKLFQMSWVFDYEQIQVASWHENFMFFVLLAKKFSFHRETLMFLQNWIPTVQGIAMGEKLVSEQWKFFDWLCISGRIFCRVVLNLHSSCPNNLFGENYTLRKNIRFFIVFGFWVKTFATWQVECGWVIKTGFFLPCGKSRRNFHFFFVLTSSQSILYFLRKTFGRIFKSDFYVILAVLWQKLQFPQKLRLSYHFGF